MDRERGEPTYAELKEENERLRAQVEQLQEELAFLQRQIPKGSARDLQFFSSQPSEVDGADKKQAENSSSDTPNILICGLPGSGKTSIRKVVFENGSPDFQARNQPTTEPAILHVDRGELKFDLVELPFTYAQQDTILIHAKQARSLLFVLDAQELYEDPLAWACRLIKRLNQINRNITFHLLLHKMDGDHMENPDQRREILRHVHEFLEETLETDADVSVHCTSIYHPTLFEALSKVIQSMMPHLASMEFLLNTLVEKNKMEKALLMDGQTKLVICSDSSPEPLPEHLSKFACDMMDLTDGFSSVKDCDMADDLVITFEQDFIIRLRYIMPALVLVFVSKTFNAPSKLVDYNLAIFDKAVLRLLKDLK